MGLIKAVFDAMGGSFADAWLEVIEADNMSDTTVFTSGVKVRNDRRNSNNKGSVDHVSDGSVIHVYDNQFMLLVDGGKVVDYTAEPGYYKVDMKTAPSTLSGGFGDSLKEFFNRVKHGGTPSSKQKVFFINLQEIKGLRFGTRTPVNYFDNFYNAELFLRAHGTYSIKITNPLKFYSEVIPRDARRVDINAINEQYLNEFLEGLTASINKMSLDGIRISHVASKSTELSKYMSRELDESWNSLRGFEVLSVGIASISYDEESKKLINMRNQGAMLSDPTVRQGYVQGAVARGIENAGENGAGGFVGVGMGMNMGAGFMQSASQNNQGAPAGNGWTCSCGAYVNGNFCSNCGGKKPSGNEGTWTCSCGKEASGKFCSNCGNKKPEASFCPKCGEKVAPGARFCSVCGFKLD